MTRATTPRTRTPPIGAEAPTHVAGPSTAGWRVGVGVLWLLAVLLAYYAVHKPITAADLAALREVPLGMRWQVGASATRLLNEFADVLVATWAVLLAGALGHRLWHVLRWPEPDRAEARLIGGVLGLGILGLATFGFGSLGLLSRPWAFALLGFPALLLWRDVLTTGRWWLRVLLRGWRAGWAAGTVERLALLFSAATLTLIVLAALLPPTTAWDALSYHLVSARADAAAGRIVLDPGNPQVYQPQLMEMLYTLLYLVRGGDTATALLHAACGGLVLALVGLSAWRMGGPRAATRAIALVFAIPTVALLAGWAYVDLGLAAAELAALAALPLWRAAMRGGDPRAGWRWLWAAALAAGVALNIKYTAAYVVAALAMLIGFAAWRDARPLVAAGGMRARMLAALRPSLLFGAVASVVGSLWPIRNLVVTGDPFFPYHLGPFFPGGPNWDAARTAFMQGRGWGASVFWRAPLLPLETTLLGRQGSSEFDATLGPLLLILLPLGLLTLGAWRHRLGDASDAPLRLRALLYWPLASAALLGVIWSEELARSGVAMQSRLFLVIFLALAPPAALAWLRLEALRVPAVSLGRLVAVAAILCFGLTLAGQAVQTLQPANLAELAGAQARGDYETQQLGPYALAMRRLDALGPRAHVLLLWEPRGYLTTASVRPDVFLDAFDLQYRRCGAAAEIARCLRAQGFTAVLLYQQGLRLVRTDPANQARASEFAALDTFLASLPIVYEDDTPLLGPGRAARGWYVLYSLVPGT
ncbi:MAG TPA: hypothetical protein VF818_00840 [Ktedonobacterales bacterium]